MKNICIIGAGAMGCLIGGLIQRAGYDVTFIARGTQLAALNARGLTLRTTGDEWQAPVRATATAAEAGKQDVILIATKAYQLASALPYLPPLMHENTVVLPAINGMPWWYFHKHGGPFDGRTLEILDPGSRLTQGIPTDRLIGCVNYLAGSLVAPAEVHYVPEIARRIAIGELDAETSPRLEAVGDVFADAGFEPVRSKNIRQSVWHKLWGNISFNPIGALTHGTLDQLAEGYHDIDLLSAVMNEARFIADKLDIDMGQTIKSRVDAAARMRGHKASMLQDIEAGRPTEIDAIVGAVREIGKWLEVDTPYLNTLYSLVKLKERFYYAATAPHA